MQPSASEKNVFSPANTTMFKVLVYCVFVFIYVFAENGEGYVIQDTANITMDDINFVNEKYFFPVVDSLTKTQFFSIFKINLKGECPFWAVKKMCGIEGGCSVCECDEKDVPLPWKVSKISKVNTFLNKMGQQRKWKDDNSDSWQPEIPDAEHTYVNLLLNPETNTGYDGKEASKIWHAIYTFNCFHGGDLNQMCLEERMFYRLLSGLHQGITLKIATYYYKKPEYVAQKPKTFTLEMFDPNLDFFEYGILPFPDRMQNFYFLYSFVLRALQKGRKFLLNYDYSIGNPEADNHVRELVHKLLRTEPITLNPDELEQGEKLVNSPCCFDETCLFKSQCFQKGSRKHEFISQMKQNFRNITMLMDCVSCERCKMWAKLELLGLSVSLRIVMSETTQELENVMYSLQRNEIIALINTFKQLSQSVEDYKRLKGLVWRRRWAPRISIGFTIFIISIIIIFFIKVLFSKRKSPSVYKKKRVTEPTIGKKNN